MAYNQNNGYNLDPHIPELYDQSETYTDDVELIQRLITGRKKLRILEPFCGNGRILIPLALDGHELVGMDLAQVMLNNALEKISHLSSDVQKRITLIQPDAFAPQTHL